MKKKWLVGYEREAIVVVETEADAEEMVMSLVAEEAYVGDLIFGVPSNWNYARVLIYYSRGYWIEEVAVL